MRSRREFLRDAALLAGVWALPRPARASAAPPPRPRSFIQIILSGGIDALLSTDPKPRGAVVEQIVVPYAEEAIVRAGTVAVAPPLAPLGAGLARLAIVNGVRCATAAHHTGMARLQQMRMIELPESRDFASVLGERLRRSHPLDVLRLGVYSHDYFFPTPDRSLTVYQAGGSAPQRFVEGQARERQERPWSTLDLICAGQDQRRDAARLLDEQAVRRSEAAAWTTASRFLADLAFALPEPTPLKVAHPPQPLRLPGVPSWQESAARWSVTVRDTLFALQHRLAPAIVIVDPSSYDTHLYNLPSQLLALTTFVAALQQLLERLQVERSPDGNLLADEVGIVISSELGRFPIMNSWGGKDHLPELPVMFWGPGIRPGSYGKTDAQMLATPISLSSGRPDASAGKRVPTIDELAATVFEWFGVRDGLSSGYPGYPMDFLLS